MYETDIKALPLRFWHLLKKHLHILQFWDSVESIHLLWLILAVLEHAPNAFSKGEELPTKSGTLCNADVKIHPSLIWTAILDVLFQENKILLVIAVIIVNYIFGTGQTFYLQLQRMDNLTLTWWGWQKECEAQNKYI